MRRYTSEEEMVPVPLPLLQDALDSLILVSEPKGIPFPQANSFDRIIDLCVNLDFRNIDKDRIAEEYRFVYRQADYYARAAEYLGLVRRNEKKEVELDDEGINFLELQGVDSTLYIIMLVLKHVPFLESFDMLLASGEMPSADAVADVIRENTWYTGSTPRRRASTVIAWLKWIWCHVEQT